MPDVSKIKNLLNQTGLQQTDPQLYQVILQIIKAIQGI